MYTIHTFKQHYSSKEFVSLGKYQTTKVFHAGQNRVTMDAPIFKNLTAYQT